MHALAGVELVDAEGGDDLVAVGGDALGDQHLAARPAVGELVTGFSVRLPEAATTDEDRGAAPVRVERRGEASHAGGRGLADRDGRGHTDDHAVIGVLDGEMWAWEEVLN